MDLFTDEMRKKMSPCPKNPYFPNDLSDPRYVRLEGNFEIN